MHDSIYRFINTYGEQKIIHKVVNIEHCHDIVRNIFYFLQGCSFARISIANAFRDIAEEMEPENETTSDNKY